MGFENEAEQSNGRPYRQIDGRSKRPNELTSSIVPRGTSFHRSVELGYSPGLTHIVALSRARGTRRDLTGPTYGVLLADPGHFANRHGHYTLLAFPKTIK